MIKTVFKQKFDKEIKQLAIKHKISIDKVVDIYYNQFEFAAKSVRNNEKSNIKLKGFGTFVYNSYFADKLTELKEKKNERKILSQTTSEDGNGTELNQNND